MITTVLFANSTVQLVLTPETDWEKRALNSVKGDKSQVHIMHGSFGKSHYECTGGWIREGSDESLIVRIDPIKTEGAT